MRRRVWTSSPWFLIFSVLMLLMGCVSYRYNHYLCYIEIGASVISMVIVIVCSIRFKRYLKQSLENTLQNISSVNEAYLERYKIPIAVIGKHEEIIWSNSYFKRGLCHGRDPIGDGIAPFVSDTSIDFLSEGQGVDVVVEGKYYTVYCNKTELGMICIYIDNTYFKTTIKKFKDTKASVALVVFDNREDFINDNEEESARIVLSVESTLQRWATSCNALYKKLSGNKYMLVLESNQLIKMTEDKFPILKEIRHIKLNQREATISIGIGRDADGLRESEKRARNALEMALGRGGDQVAVMNANDTYEFYGGISSGVEKLSKVRTRVIANTLAKALAESDKVFIMGHRFSDLDCVGASIGMQRVISKTMKKYCRIVIDEEKSMASVLINQVKTERKDEEIFISPADVRGITSRTLLVVLDTHTTDFLESEEVYNKCQRVVVIDHHRKMVNFIKNSLVFCLEPTASSASEMCTEIIGYIGDEAITSLEAESLLAGIVLDTKNFVIKTGVRTFEAAAYLRRKGADTITVKRFFADNIETYKEKYNIVSQAQIYNGCAISITDNNMENIRLVAAQAADELLMISDVYASFVIFGTQGGVVNISARSYGKINVQIIMEKLGGGGHQNMAAVQIKGKTFEDVKAQLIGSIDEVLADEIPAEEN